MDSLKVCTYIENSFLNPLIKNPDITDISYNGKKIFYLDNKNGRMLSDINIDYGQAKDFVRQIANLCEKQFSYQTPQLDVSVSRYRINAVHQCIAKRSNDDVINFSIRIASSKLRINEKSGFLTPELVEFFDILMDKHVSIVIGGETGCGKTEFQKYLLSRMKSNTRVIVIDSALELDFEDLNPDIDLNIWQANDEIEDRNTQALIKNALRSNPDWLIAAEARGKEMVDVLNSALTGHPIITTIHAFDCKSMPSRMTRMVLSGTKNSSFNDVFYDLSYHLRVYVYLKRKIQKDGKVIRYISEIYYLNNKNWEPIYIKEKTGKFYKFSKELKEFLNIEKPSDLFKKTFLEGKNI